MTKPAYKLAHIDKTEVALAARKGLMVADSHYFAWPAKQQERFRATMGEKTLLNLILTMCRLSEVTGLKLPTRLRVICDY